MTLMLWSNSFREHSLEYMKLKEKSYPSLLINENAHLFTKPVFVEM